MPRIAPLARFIRPTLPPPVARALPMTIGQSSRSSLPLARPSILSSSLSSFLRPTTPTNNLSNLSQLPLLNALSGTSRQPTQIRTLAYGAMYQPSQRKRKRKHGFLSRSKGGRLGKKTLARRLARGRRFLSH